jgi:hypothetical protein
VTAHRTTTWKDKDGALHEQSFVFKQGGELLFEAKRVQASPSATQGAVLFPGGLLVEAQRPGSCTKSYVKDVTTISLQEDSTCTLAETATAVALWDADKHKIHNFTF